MYFGAGSNGPNARALIEAKEYRYLIQVLWHDKAGRIGRLKGAGLTHNPNLRLKALAAEEAPMPMNIPATPATPDPKAPDPAAMLARIIALPGLPPDADAQALMAALEKALADPDPKRFIPIAAVHEMLRDRNARLATLSEAAAGAKVDDALRRGCITPPLRNWALALCRQDPDAFDGFLSVALPAFAHLTKVLLPGICPGTPGGAAGTPDEIAICSAPGLPPGSSSPPETGPLSGRPGRAFAVLPDGTARRVRRSPGGRARSDLPVQMTQAARWQPRPRNRLRRSRTRCASAPPWRASWPQPPRGAMAVCKACLKRPSKTLVKAPSKPALNGPVKAPGKGPR